MVEVIKQDNTDILICGGEKKGKGGIAIPEVAGKIRIDELESQEGSASVLSIDMLLNHKCILQMSLQLLGDEDEKFIDELSDFMEHMKRLDLITINREVVKTGSEPFLVDNGDGYFIFNPIEAYISIMDNSTTGASGYELALEALMDSFGRDEFRMMFIKTNLDPKGNYIFDTYFALQNSSILSVLRKTDQGVDLGICEEDLTPIKELKLILDTMTSVALASNFGVMDIFSILPNPMLMFDTDKLMANKNTN